MINRDNPYEARRRPRSRYVPTKPPALQPSFDQKVTTRHGTSMPHLGDTRDAHLNGKGSPFSAAHVGRKK